MKCIIIDDEPLARQLLESYISQVEGLTLIKSCENAIEAFSFLQQRPVDLIFLDIQMPQITGIDLLRSLKDCPRVILTTAFREYAYDAYDLDVADYLLKPISFDRFLRGLSKVYQIKKLPETDAAPGADPTSYGEAYLYFKADREMIKVYLNEIEYIESLRDYVRVKTHQKQIITYQKISYLEHKLPENKFIRIHRSFIVPLDKVSSFTANTVKIGAIDLPIGRNYKNETLKALNRNNILS